MVDFLLCFKEHLLWNYEAKFNETSQEASLGDRLQKYNKALWLSNNNNRMVDFLFCFKEHLLWNYEAKFNETSQEASLGDRLQKYNTLFRLVFSISDILLTLYFS